MQKSFRSAAPVNVRSVNPGGIERVDEGQRVLDAKQDEKGQLRSAADQNKTDQAANNKEIAKNSKGMMEKLKEKAAHKAREAVHKARGNTMISTGKSLESSGKAMEKSGVSMVKAGKSMQQSGKSKQQKGQQMVASAGAFNPGQKAAGQKLIQQGKQEEAQGKQKEQKGEQSKKPQKDAQNKAGAEAGTRVQTGKSALDVENRIEKAICPSAPGVSQKEKVEIVEPEDEGKREFFDETGEDESLPLLDVISNLKRETDKGE